MLEVEELVFSLEVFVAESAGGKNLSGRKWGYRARSDFLQGEE